MVHKENFDELYYENVVKVDYKRRKNYLDTEILEIVKKEDSLTKQVHYHIALETTSYLDEETQARG